MVFTGGAIIPGAPGTAGASLAIPNNLVIARISPAPSPTIISGAAAGALPVPAIGIGAGSGSGIGAGFASNKAAIQDRSRG